MNESQKQELLDLIEMYASFNVMFKEALFDSLPKEHINNERWNLFKAIRDEKLSKIKQIIGEIK